MRGYSSRRLQANDAILCNNWDSHNTFCDSTFIYFTKNSFAAPSYNTITISPALPMRNLDVTKLPLVSGDSNDEKLFDNSTIDLSDGNDCTKVYDKESGSDIKLKRSCGTNNTPTPNSRMSLCVTNDNNNLMNTYFSRNRTIGDI